MRVPLLACLFPSGSFSDGWLNINRKRMAGWFAVVPAAYFMSCSFPPQASITSCSAVSTPPASWWGRAVEIPGALFPPLTWSRSDFGGEEAAWGPAGLSGCCAVVGGTGGPEVPRVLNTRRVSCSVASTCVTCMRARERGGCLFVWLPDTWWPGPRRVALGLLELPRSTPSLRLCAVPWPLWNCAQNFFDIRI